MARAPGKGSVEHPQQLRRANSRVSSVSRFACRFQSFLLYGNDAYADSSADEEVHFDEQGDSAEVSSLDDELEVGADKNPSN